MKTIQLTGETPEIIRMSNEKAHEVVNAGGGKYVPKSLHKAQRQGDKPPPAEKKVKKRGRRSA